MNQTQFMGPVLFLDTPRGADGKNHVFVVSSKGKECEALILQASESARRQPLGRNYVSVSRSVGQVTRGQLRSGEELLVFYGIQPCRDNVVATLRDKMIRMLDSIDQNALGETDGDGMTVHKPLMDRFESMLLTVDGVVPEPVQVSGRKRRFPLRMILAGLAGIAIAIIFVCQNESKKGNGDVKKRTGQGEDGTSSGEVTSGRPVYKASEWRFLQDKEWRALATLTGLPEGTVGQKAPEWAIRVLEEADPFTKSNPKASASEFSKNRNVELLLVAVQSGIKMDGNTARSISEKWLHMRGHEAVSLIEIWNELDNEKQESSPPIKLRKLIASWWRAKERLSGNLPQLMSSDANPHTLSPKRLDNGGDDGFKILTELDLQMFLEVSRFLDGQDFAPMIADTAIGKDWISSDWPRRFEQLRDLGNNVSVNPAIRSFCRELSDAVLTYHRGSSMEEK